MGAPKLDHRLYKDRGDLLIGVNMQSTERLGTDRSLFPIPPPSPGSLIVRFSRNSTSTSVRGYERDLHAESR